MDVYCQACSFFSSQHCALCMPAKQQAKSHTQRLNCDTWAVAGLFSASDDRQSMFTQNVCDFGHQQDM